MIKSQPSKLIVVAEYTQDSMHRGEQLIAPSEGAANSWRTALLLSIFLGPFGADRFYLGQVSHGIAKVMVNILTLGIGGFIWWVIDVILIATKNIRGVDWSE